MILNNVDRYRVVEAMVEGVRIILNYRGEPYSPAYVQGISGAAFHIAGICPCAPTCTPGIEPLELARLFGYQAEQMPLFNEVVKYSQLAPDELLYALIERVKEDIRHDKPVLVWHAFTNAEWDVVAGFDEEKKVFYGRGSYQGLDGYAEASWTRPRDAIEICPAMGAIFIGDKVSEFDARQAEVASLHAAVAHAHSHKNAEKMGGSEWCFLEGFLAYQRWMEDYKSPEKMRGLGDAYCYGIYRSTHRAASDYLNELAAKYPQAQHLLTEGSNHFKAEADTLDQAESLLWWNSPEGPDAVRNQQASAALEKAYSNYRQGIDAIAEATTKMT
jgi:hypothetical protein